MYGPGGENSGGGGNTNNNVEPDVEKINASNNQNSGISAWDVTVRSSESSTTDIKGRLFTFYITLNMGDNGRQLHSDLYPVTVDGYRYKLDMKGLDPFGFRIFGNQLGNLDSDGETPLYRDVVGKDGGVLTPWGGTSTAPPQFPIFFNQVDTAALPFITLYDTKGQSNGTGISPAPILPQVTNPNFQGTSSGNTSTVNTGGTFSFNSNVPGNYQIIISRDGQDFDPTNPQNRVLRGATLGGPQSVTWNGKDNSAQPFPVGNDYPYRITVNSGEYHFPMSDAENNFSGGPEITLLNASNPLGNTTAFYDDRGYVTIGGTSVGTPGQPLCGVNPPNPAFTDPVLGANSSAPGFRKFGTASGGNENDKNNFCNSSASFGDTKTLDMWIYVPSEAKQAQLNIVASNVDVSGTLYEDSDGEDDFDTNEPRLPKDITVTLYNDANDNNVIDDGEEVATTTTDDNGDYIFDEVPDGDYKIKVDTTDTDIPSGNTLGTPNDLAVTVSGSAVTNQNFGFDKTVANNPIVLLVKRITAINQTLYTSFVDGVDNGDPQSSNYVPAPKDAEDNNPNWIANFLQGEIAGVKVQPNDEIEYTIYYLSAGDSEAKNVLFCDRIPENVTFIPNSFNNEARATGGLQNANRGILWLKDGNTESLTNNRDGDFGQYFPPRIEPSSVYPNIDCDGPNINGAVVVDLSDLPNATEPGIPNTSYGFVRFRGRVK